MWLLHNKKSLFWVLHDIWAEFAKHTSYHHHKIPDARMTTITISKKSQVRVCLHTVYPPFVHVCMLWPTSSDANSILFAFTGAMFRHSWSIQWIPSWLIDWDTQLLDWDIIFLCSIYAMKTAMFKNYHGCFRHLSSVSNAFLTKRSKIWIWEDKQQSKRHYSSKSLGDLHLAFFPCCSWKSDKKF